MVLTQKKAKKIIKHGEVGVKKLTKRQRGLMHLVAAGGLPTRLRKT